MISLEFPKSCGMLSIDLIITLGLYLKPSVIQTYTTLLYYWFKNACIRAQAETKVSKLLSASTENHKMRIISYPHVS